MSQSVEIEYKNMLTKEEYKYLLRLLPYESRIIRHKNHYFDTKSYTLQQNRTALRIREAKNQYTLTLKEPAEVGSLETKEIIDQAIMIKWLNNQPTLTPIIAKQLWSYNVTLKELKYFGFLETRRTLYEVSPEIVIALDHSFYHDLNDYELEVEGLREKMTKQFFQSLLKDYKIQQRPTKPKIRRFFDNI